MTFGQNLRAVRKRRHLSQTELAAKLGTTQTVVSHWESGATVPDVTWVQQICRALDVQPNELLQDNEERS